MPGRITRWPPCTLAHRRAGRKRGQGTGQQQMTLWDIRVSSAQRRARHLFSMRSSSAAKPCRVSMGSAAERGQLTNRVSHSTPRLAERAPDYESGGQEFESLRARQQASNATYIFPIATMWPYYRLPISYQIATSVVGLILEVGPRSAADLGRRFTDGERSVGPLFSDVTHISFLIR